ncbi:hypothetical protein NRB16_14980 [Pseudomonas sp. LJDD11]|uniref:hypothetical protein n=1 Tax=Pseudomonas sp. LJDD11 TaxID=2931984 RepID=UPI00211C20A7|nr:hypothetical protein [Pseudomonas sp. LJDD11]MCQ9424823.1 hypothetical protein [Pseudomonas sp. LJDD11]
MLMIGLGGAPLSAAEVDDTALAFVQQRHLGDGLGWQGYQMASRTAVFAGLVDALGKTRAQVLVQGELQRLQPQYQGRWEQNLAAAYAHSFSVEELRQLNDGKGSPALMNRFKARNNEVGQEMKARSADLLAEFVSRALESVRKNYMP